MAPFKSVLLHEHFIMSDYDIMFCLIYICSGQKVVIEEKSEGQSLEYTTVTIQVNLHNRKAVRI